MMKFYCLSILLLIGIENCIGQDQNANDNKTIFDFPIENRERVSIIQLIANPEKYEGKVIEVSGFLSLEIEGQALYLQKEDYEFFNRKNGITVLASIDDKTKKECDLKFVTIIGKFQQKVNTHKTDWSGWIITSKIYRDISRKELKHIR